jgi:23S rRNA pseudouridine1911/1915/1917 synthase
MILEGRVLLDGRPAPKAGAPLTAGAALEVRPPPPPSDLLVPEDVPFTVLHEDDALVVVDKPAGVVVHPGHGRRSGTLVHGLLARGIPLAPAGGSDRPGIVHRLDRDTSGLLVVAKTDAAHRALASAFARREVDKTYLALVWGHPKPPSGRIERAIGRSRSDRTKMSVAGPRGRPALSSYRTLETMPGFALLEVTIATGRTHQIRVHLLSLHHPVVGDTRYAGERWRGVPDPIKRKALRELPRLALHAAALGFRHPDRGEPMQFRSPLPEDLLALAAVLRKAA